MYHVKNDIRADKSSELLYEGLMKVLETKPLSHVSISDVSRASTVSRSTFYRNFDVISDILYWKCDKEFYAITTAYIESEPDITREDEYLLTMLRYWMEPGRTKLVDVLVQNGAVSLIYNSMIRSETLLLNYYQKRGLLKTDDYKDGYMDYFVAIRVGYFIAMLQTWIMRGKKETPEEVTAIVQSQHHQVVNSRILF
jgi:hypothetical protein